MNVIKTILVDDEANNRAILRSLLHNFSPECHIVGEAQNIRQAQELIERHQPNLAFLDVSLPPDNIFDWLKTLPQINFSIIFVTAHHHYALEAFGYSAVSYLLKPIDEQMLLKVLTQVRMNLQYKELAQTYQTLLYNLTQPSSQEVRICLPHSLGFDIVKASEIMYCSADSNYTFVYLRNEKPICISKTLSETENILPKEQFFRVHKSHLVNINYVKKFVKTDGGMLVMENNTELEISRRKKNEFLAFLEKKLL
ncbi:MAG: LytTR family DNA-binding domain-containing protein [Thermonemataceae bacterium]|nr:LytTR family DNA-binding domain-containing protein [Thermonemataceae bacterium]